MNSVLECVSAVRVPAVISAACSAFCRSTYWSKAVTNSSLVITCGGVKRPVLLMATRCMVSVSCLLMLKLSQNFSCGAK